MAEPLNVIDLSNILKCLTAALERSTFLPEEVPHVVRLNTKLTETLHQYHLSVAAEQARNQLISEQSESPEPAPAAKKTRKKKEQKND